MNRDAIMNHDSLLSRKRTIPIGVLLAVPVILIGLYLWFYNPFALGCPSDSELNSLYRTNREALESLRTMAAEDVGVVSYLSDDTLEKSTLSATRRTEYRKLLSGIRRNLVMRINADAVSFSYSGGGASLAIDHSWMKGIAYLPNGFPKVGVIVSSLDTLPTKNGTYLVPIEGNWYVVYSQLD